MASFWTFIGVAASVVTALPWDGAGPTDPVVAVETLGWTPIPTQPPLLSYSGKKVPMAGKHIFARAISDQLCGYVSTNSERAWTCDYSLATCTSSSGWFGCCSPVSTGTSCDFETACIDAVERSACDASCLANSVTVKCTESSAPYCIMFIDADAGVSGWGCTRYSGLTETIMVNSAITMVSETPVAPSSSESVTSGDPKSNVGAIAGGVVGGLAVVVLGGLGLFLVLSRRKKTAATAAAQGQTGYQPGAPPGQPMIVQPPMQPIHHGGYPDQIWNNQVYASAAQPQMMPQQQSHQAKYADSEVTTPVDCPQQYGAQPQPQYYPPQQEGYYVQQPQQPQR